MEIQHIDPWELVPPHEPREDFAELVDSMGEDGWTGRPLLIVEDATGTYHAWTGSHRIAAAREVGLESVPCYIVDEADINLVGHSATDVFLADWERLEVIRKIDDEAAIELMAAEVRGG